MVVIKSKLSGFYWKDFGVWTRDPCQAKAFSDEWYARGFARRERIEDITVADQDSSGGSMERSAAA